ncbi:unnamed protein product [Rotaria socialis]|uniref:Uncharacterized protein n=1 Tax=Rotaria socialis TaxID=392032 RepID=A0A817ZVD2_9BILA|nr:unnamed protein product [Rotaria socialis]
MKFSWFVLLIILVVCRTSPLYNTNNDDDNYVEDNYKIPPLTAEQLTELGQYLKLKYKEESESDVLSRMIDHSDENDVSKRDALWTTTEVLECIRRLRHSKNISKLDLVTEMLNCYRRLKHSG